MFIFTYKSDIYEIEINGCFIDFFYFSQFREKCVTKLAFMQNLPNLETNAKPNIEMLKM
jgi:hypothetical protein